MDEAPQNSIWPMPTFYFTVTFESLKNDAVFQEVSGLDTETEVIDYRHSHFSGIKMPGIARVGTVTLKKGVFPSDTDLYTWLSAINTNTLKPEKVTIHLLDQCAHPTMTWHLRNAWPVKILGTDKNEEADEFVVDTLELCYEGVTTTNY